MLYCNVEANGVYRLPARGVIGMKWVRSNIKLGARVALFALAVQFALSFGHFHAIAAQAPPSIQSIQHLPTPGPDSDRHADDLCDICAVIALTGTAVASAPPALPLPQAIELPRQTTETTFLRLHAARAAFQSRAPPLS
jgi:hypothetical protein